MSLEAILEAIETSGREKIEQIQEQAKKEVDEILEAAREEAQSIREQERQKALRSARRERAHLLHEARSHQLKIHQEGRDHIIEEILERTRERLQDFRTEQAYEDLLQRFVDESFEALSASLVEDETPVLEIDPRDRDSLENKLAELPRNFNIEEGTKSWGGVALSSQDRRVRVINTLESRMERATPFLCVSLTARLENEG